jgi:hypothetical protein
VATRIGNAKAVSATARRIAVLFYNAMRFGMNYSDPGADYTSKNTERASSSDYIAARHSLDSHCRLWIHRIPCVFLRKASAFFAREMK